MGICLLQKKGMSVDYSEVTAVEADVAGGKTFLKSNGEKGTGTMKTNGSPVYQLPINGEIILPDGNYGGGKVTQSVSVFAGQKVNVGKNPVTVETANKYANANIIIPAVKNLVPTNIRKGKYVGGIGPGTWEGYINDDPNVPFYYGTFGPGYSPVTFASYVGGTHSTGSYTKGSAGLGKGYYYLSTEGYLESIALSFSKQIDFTKYSKMIILGENVNLYQDLYIAISQNKVESWLYTTAGDGAYNSAMGNIYLDTKVSLRNSGVETEVSLSNVNNSGYLYFYLGAKMGNPQDFNIYYVRFE